MTVTSCYDCRLGVVVRQGEKTVVVEHVLPHCQAYLGTPDINQYRKECEWVERQNKTLVEILSEDYEEFEKIDGYVSFNRKHDHVFVRRRDEKERIKFAHLLYYRFNDTWSVEYALDRGVGSQDVYQVSLGQLVKPVKLTVEYTT